jgi:flagellin
MLNRMVTLAEESANGTYQDDVDRENLQSEMDALKEEINRIADSANFNGINLLDGTQAGSGSGASAVNLSVAGTASTITASGGAQFKQTITLSSVATGKAGTLDLKYLDDSGNVQTASIKWDSSAASTSNSKAAAALAKVLGSNYSVTGSATSITIEAKENGATEFQALSVSQTSDGAVVSSTNAKVNAINTQGKDDVFALTMTSVTDVTKDNFIEIDGQKYQIVTRGKTVASDAKALYVDKSAAGAFTADEAASIADQLKSYGVNASIDDTTKTTINIAKSTSNSGGSGGLTLQIGDTSDSYNQMTVSIDDMHTTSMGIDGISISTQSSAAAAISVIKDAINYVSSTRGTLGATQNRLEHTSNNLSVMTENIQDAESTIRDTDIAEEMTSYTKNNILVQSAQAMLAQANSVPQGVLQLLQ